LNAEGLPALTPTPPAPAIASAATINVFFIIVTPNWQNVVRT
jgi:hypothetical protein